MSTRCMVKITDTRESEITLYHHHDGYPEGVGFDLMHRSETWKYWNIDAIANELVKDTSDEYEITVYDHVDSEYVYTIDCKTKTIKCEKYSTGEEVAIPYKQGAGK